MFSSKEIANALMAELDENLDGQISFDEFIKSMAFICALVNVAKADSSDFRPLPWYVGTPDKVHELTEEEVAKQEINKMMKKFWKKFGK